MVFISYIDQFSIIVSCLILGSFSIITFYDWLKRADKIKAKKVQSHLWHVPVLLLITFVSGLAIFIGYTSSQIIGIIPLSPYYLDVSFLLSFICIATFSITHLVWLFWQFQSVK